MDVTSYQIRKSIFAAVPQYKNLIGRLRVQNCSFGNFIIHLVTGLVTDDARQVYDEVGTLNETHRSIIDQIEKEFNCSVKQIGVIMYSYRSYSQELLIEITQ